MNKSENISSLISQSLREVRKEQENTYKDKLKLEAHMGIVSKIRYFLYSKPYLIHIISFAILFLGLVIGFLVREFTENLPDADKLEIRLVYILFFVWIYLFIPFLLEVLKPKLKIEWLQLWKNTIEKLFTKTNWNSYDEAIYYLKIENKSYIKNGKVLKFTCQLLWGGIFIGCLPITEFQNALISLSPIQILKTNLFGGLSICILPLLYSCYYFKYDLPSAYIDNALDTIELVREQPENSSFGRYKGQIEISDDFNEEDEEINQIFGV